ncbi:MAG: hypothetical protein KGZ42_09215 [Melioribacter sp.]|nr:hypothetical protein [Melioribacter sp.]
MKNISTTLIIYILSLEVVFSQRMVKDANFTTVFKKVMEIQLSNEVPIGSVGSFDCNEHSILITDAVSKKVILYNYDGKFVKLLNPEECTPGFLLNPIYATFSRNENIYVINEFNTGYIFDPEGLCIGPMHSSFIRVPHICFLNSDEIVAYSNLGDGNYLKLMNKFGKEIEKFGDIPQTFKNIIERFRGGGLVSDKYGYIYRVDVLSPTIYQYKNKKIIKRIEKYPSNFKNIFKDIINPQNPADLIKQYKNISENNSIVTNLYIANEKLLLIQYYHNKKYSVQLISTDGNQFLSKPIDVDSPFIFAKKGRAFKIYQPIPDISGNLPNPKVIVYEINF